MSRSDARGTHASRAALGHRAFGLAGASAAVLVGACDWVLVAEIARPDGLWDELLLLLALIGNAIPLAAAATLVLWLAAGLRDRLPGRHPTLTVAGLLGASTTPYAFSVVRETFSGPQLQSHALRMPLMLVAVSTVVAGAAIVTAIALRRSRVGRQRRLLLGSSLVAVTIAVLTASQSFRPDEYVELHALAASSALLAALAGLLECVRASSSPLLRWRPLPWLVAIMSMGWALGAMTLTTRSPTLAWVVWSETPFSRYVTSPWWRNSSSVDDIDAILELEERTFRRAREYRQRAKQRPAPHIVIFTIDNLSADRVGAHGYLENPTTPNIDDMAAQGVLFEHAHSVFPQTRYFSSALLLGRYIGRFTNHVMPSSYRSLAFTRLLAEARGYRIFATNFFEVTNRRSFRARDYAIDEFVPPHQRPEHLNQDVDDLLERVGVHARLAVREERPLLVWMHLIRPHLQTSEAYDFDASDEFPFGNDNDDRYDSAIAASDAVLADLRAIIDAMDDGRDVVWVIGSDHGAGMQRYEGKAIKSLYSDHTHVPLIVVAPGIEAGRISRPVEAPLDVTPTLLELAGLEPPEAYHGRSLLPDLLGVEVEDRPVVLGYNRRRPSDDDAKQPPRWRGIVMRPWKLVRREHQLLLTNYEDDPLELTNLVEDHPDVAQRLDALAREILNRRLHEFYEALDEQSRNLER